MKNNNLKDKCFHLEPEDMSDDTDLVEITGQKLGSICRKLEIKHLPVVEIIEINGKNREFSVGVLIYDSDKIKLESEIKKREKSSLLVIRLKMRQAKKRKHH